MPTPEIRGGEFSELARDFLEITGTGRSSLAEIAETAPFAEHPKETLLRIAHAAARTHARRPYARRALDHAECPERIRPTLPIIRDLLAMAEREGRAPVPSPVLGTGTILPFATAFILEAACDFGVEGAVLAATGDGAAALAGAATGWTAEAATAAARLASEAGSVRAGEAGAEGNASEDT